MHFYIADPETAPEGNCRSLGGAWYNELGSNMNITQDAEGFLHGRYHTIVQLDNGTYTGLYGPVYGKSTHQIVMLC